MRAVFLVLSLVGVISCAGAEEADSDDDLPCPSGTAHAGDVCLHCGSEVTNAQYCTFEDGTRHGPVREYIVNTRIEGRYEKDLQVGEWRVYSEKSGALLGSFTMVDGTGDESYFYESGALLWRGHRVAGKRQGVFQYYKESGELSMTQVYEDDVVVRFEGSDPLDITDWDDEVPDPNPDLPEPN